MEILKVSIVGLRYYPVLVTFCAKETVLYIFTCLYMWYDLFETLYSVSACDQDDVPDGKILPYFLTQKILQVLPTLFFSAYIVVNLTYRSIRNCYRLFTGSEVNYSLFNMDNNDEIFYSHSDVVYVSDLLKKKPRLEENDNQEAIRKSPCERANVSDSIRHYFHRWIYDWHPTFKFSSRFVNTQTVALVVLYHLFVTIFYLSFEIYFYVNDAISEIKPDGQIIMDELVKFLKSIQSSFQMVLFLPLCLALFVTLAQFFLAIKDFKTHVLQIYKGKCDYIPSRNKLTNGFISGIF
jgi:hypothetical protein